MTTYRSEWGETVRRHLGDRTYRDVAERANISHSYIGDWLAGKVPSRRLVLEFARVVDADPVEILEAAGYPPPSPQEVVLLAIQEVLSRGGGLQLDIQASDLQTLEQAQRIANGLRRALREGHL